MRKTFRGRAILPVDVEGEALVTHTGFNTLASVYESIRTEAQAAICSDHTNRELFGKDLTDKILCLPKTTGSTSAGAALEKVAQMGIAPKAMLFAESIDSLAAAGVILADVWVGQRICTVDRLGREFLECVRDGQRIEVRVDGTVMVHEAEGG